MSVRIVDAKNNDAPVSEWTGAPFVVEFRRKKNSLKTPPYYGFDWVELDNNLLIMDENNISKANPDYGKIIIHKNVNIKSNDSGEKFTECQYLLEGNNYKNVFSLEGIKEEKKDAKKEAYLEEKREYLENMFPKYKISTAHEFLYTTKSWFSFPDKGVEINLQMKIRKSESDKINEKNPSRMFFDVPEGVTLTIDGVSFDSKSNKKYLEITNTKNLDVKIIYNSEEEKDQVLELLVLDKETDMEKKRTIGSLGIFAHKKIDYPIKIWTLIDISKYKNDEDKNNAISGLKLQGDKLAELNKKLEETFHQAGINMTVEYASKAIEYDMKSEKYKDYKDGKDNIKKNNAAAFFDKIVENYKNQLEPEDYKGTHLIIVDRQCYLYTPIARPPNTYNPSEGSSGNTIQNGGLAYIKSHYCLLFKNALSDYGVYAHEIGHTLGCAHVFMDTLSMAQESSLDDEDLMIKKYKWDYAYRFETEKFNNFLDKNPSKKKNYDDALKTISEYQQATTTSEEQEVKYKNAIMVRDGIGAEFYDLENLSDDIVDSRIIQKNNLSKSLERILYLEGGTTNVMDYHNDHEDFFYWQWLMLRGVAKNHLKIN